MPAPFSWIEPHPHGIRVVPADAWVDPSIAVDRALVTHGHADHARGGHGATVATPETLAIMALRYRTGEGPDGGEARPVEYGETHRLPGGVDATYIPAGHVLGSAQVLLEHAGERVIVTGDYKRRADPTCPPFEVTPVRHPGDRSDLRPAAVHPSADRRRDGQAIASACRSSRPLRARRRLCAGQGAAGDRRAARRRARRADLPAWRDGEDVPALRGARRAELGELRLVADATKDEMRGHIVVSPPSALNDRWSRRLPEPITAMASGWMRVRQRARQRNVELPLVISDHADWNELTTTIEEVDPAETWVTHGREEALLRWCQLHPTPRPRPGAGRPGGRG